MGVNISSDFIKTTNEANAIDYRFKNIQTINLGLNYRLRKKNFDYIFSATIRRFNLTNSSSLKSFDGPDPFGYTSETTLYDFFQYKLSATVNKILLKKQNFEIYIGLGPEVLIYPEDPISGELSIGDIDEKQEVGYTEIGNSRKNPFYFGFNSTLGFNFHTKFILINPYFTYHYQQGNIFNNVVSTQNLYVSQNTVSSHAIKGSYISFGLNFHPNKSIFMKKKKL